MAQILVRGLDARVVSRLKELAVAGGRSLQAETKRILEEAAGTLTPAEFREQLESFRVSLAGRSFSDSTDLIRTDRDR